MLRDAHILPNTPVLVRAGLNAPIEHGRVANDYRLRRALPTLMYLSNIGARVIVISHIGEEGTETLAPIAAALGSLISNVTFFPESIGLHVRDAIRNMAPGHILVLENLRRNPGEVGNDEAFAKELASLADFFIQDAFDTCHRKHASIVGVPQFLPSYMGLLVEEEIAELNGALRPTAPSLAVIGGAKFSTKEPVLTALLKKYDHVFVGGALANDFTKASGVEVGRSLVSNADQAGITKLLTHPRLVIPVDFLVAMGEERRDQARVALPGDIHPNEIILDHGPGTAALLQELAVHAKTVLWNGPVGKYENGFTDGTNAFARAVATSSARSVIGGGDTIAAIEQLGLLSKFSFVSTGGGSMLDFLAKGTLPGIEVLEPHANA
ncbi:MAG: Phosphoglycerate kinase [Parcubacteria group bacterium]|nr:Phosphoglycerate kinase [Parcubacteria group bacterium]